MRHIPAPHGQCGHAVLAMVSGRTLDAFRRRRLPKSLLDGAVLAAELGLRIGPMHLARDGRFDTIPRRGVHVVCTVSNTGTGWIVVTPTRVYDPGWPCKADRSLYAKRFARRNRVVGFFQVLGGW